MRRFVSAGLALLLALSLHAQQQRVVNGQVVGEDGVPVPGVTVMKQGTSQA